MTDRAREELLEAVEPERRSSVLRLLAGGTFVVPIISSFAMRRLTLNGRALINAQTSPKTPSAF